MELHHTHFPFENRNSHRHIHKKPPADFSPQGSVSFQFEGSIHFYEGAFSSVVNRRNRWTSVGQEKTLHSFSKAAAGHSEADSISDSGSYGAVDTVRPYLPKTKVPWPRILPPSSNPR